VLTLNGATIPTLPEDVQAALRAGIPDFGMVTNPIDLTGNLVNANDFIFEAIRLALRPDDIDVLMVYLPGNFLAQAIDQLERAAAEASKAIIAIDTFALADRERLRKAGIALFTDFDQAARAVATYGNWKSRAPVAPRQSHTTSVWPSLPAGRLALSETEAKDALARFGVPVVTDTLVRTSAEARAAADRIGYPLVLKLVSPDVAHKTEHGLIRLGLADADAVEGAFEAVMAKARSMTGVRVEGVTSSPC